MTTITLVTPSFTSNSFGRTHVLWRLAKLNGYTVRVVSPEGGEVWQPLADDEIVMDCHGIGDGISTDELTALVRTSDLVTSVKPVPASFGVVEPIARKHHVPQLVDIDDPDLPRLPWMHLIARQVLKPQKYWGDTKVRLRVGRYPHLVSNPVLQRWHGGTLIPHARRASIEGEAHTSDRPVVAFVGTNHPHKGLAEVRDAVAELHAQGVSLVVTANSPSDAKPWERWVGSTSISKGQELVRRCDIVIVASHRDPWSVGQLPAKLIDAMMAGRAIGVSNLEPLTWALDDAGRVVEPGDTAAIVRVIGEYLDPARRAEAGAAARRRAEAEFGEEPLADRFRAACERAIEFGKSGLR